MFASDKDIFSVVEITRAYPNEWVAIAVEKIDADGLPSAGELLVHNAEERFVWSALKLGEDDDLIHVFHTGGSERVTAAA